MIRYLIFDSTDTIGWSDLDNRILTALKQNDSSILANNYSQKRYSVDMTKCFMPIDTLNSVIYNELTQFEKNSLVDISMQDSFWNNIVV